jgi:hypothetical protein
MIMIPQIKINQIKPLKKTLQKKKILAQKKSKTKIRKKKKRKRKRKKKKKKYLKNL